MQKRHVTPSSAHASEIRWTSDDSPPPMRVIRCHGKSLIHPLHIAPPWLQSGSCAKPFDFSQAIRKATEVVVASCQELSHIDVKRLMFSVTQARNSSKHGLQARVTPMRFLGGKRSIRRGDTEYRVQQYFVDDVEILYLVTFCLPRLLNQNFDEKLATLIHELYHISPRFDGDLRRFAGRCSVHSRSQKAYDSLMTSIARELLSSRTNNSHLDFLRLSFSQLRERHGKVIGISVPRPKILPIAKRRQAV